MDNTGQICAKNRTEHQNNGHFLEILSIITTFLTFTYNWILKLMAYQQQLSFKENYF